MAEEDQDKSEQATPFKLEEAKKKGQVPKSMDTNSWLIILVALLVLMGMGLSMLNALVKTMAFLFSQAGSIDLSLSNVTLLLQETFAFGLSTIWPLWLALAVAAIIVVLAQTGPIFTFFL